MSIGKGASATFTNDPIYVVTAVTATKAPVNNAQQQVALMAPVAVTEEQWVQCDDCHKWRRVPAEHTAPLPEKWYCSVAEEEAWPAEGGEGAAGGGGEFTIHGQTQPGRGTRGRHESMPSMTGAKRRGAGGSGGNKRR